MSLHNVLDTEVQVLQQVHRRGALKAAQALMPGRNPAPGLEDVAEFVHGLIRGDDVHLGHGSVHREGDEDRGGRGQTVPPTVRALWMAFGVF